MHSLLRRSAITLSLLLATVAAHADELQDITRMMRQGQLPQALERVDKLVASKPRDAQARFLKGLVLTEMNRANEAIQVFTKLSEDYPELPEPYNNLAVLYASQGQYEKARVALESSIRTHPSYATAHENLGDIYAKLASQAYDKALQLDSSNTGAKTKLAMIGELIGSGARAPRAPARTEPAKPAEVAAARAPSEGKAIATAGTAAKAVAARPAVEAPAKSGNGRGNDTDELIRTVHAWANAWAKKDVAGYLAYYAKEFKPPKGEARSDWEKSRKQRINAPKKIEVAIESPKVSLDTDNSARVTFRQNYHSDVIKTSGTKTLVMVKSEGKWKIREERVN